jgi:hypothetical protein
MSFGRFEDEVKRYTFPNLAKYLQRLGLEEHLDEISSNILIHQQYGGIETWSIQDVCTWITDLKFLDENKEKISQAFAKEEIDGFAFLNLDEAHWLNILKLELQDFILLRCVRDGWSKRWGQPIEIPKDKIGCTATGVVADLSYCELSMIRELVKSDELCIEFGCGLYYGQLVVLGYKEYHMHGSEWKPVGPNNDKFIMKRRRVPNGITMRSKKQKVFDSNPQHFTRKSKNLFQQQTSHIIRIVKNKNSLTETAVTAQSFSDDDTRAYYEFIPDPSKDMFQVGRMSEPINGECRMASLPKCPANVRYYARLCCQRSLT